MSSKLLKLIMAGNSGVGKTTITNRYISGKFITNLDMTIGVQFFIKNLIIDNQKILLQIWDFAGGNRFRELLKQYMNGASGVLFIISVVDHKSIEQIKEWKEILNSSDNNIPIMVVGNKIDLEEFREITKEEGEVVARNFNSNLTYVEISAKSGKNIEDCFNEITKSMLNRIYPTIVNN